MRLFLPGTIKIRNCCDEKYPNRLNVVFYKAKHFWKVRDRKKRSRQQKNLNEKLEKKKKRQILILFLKFETSLRNADPTHEQKNESG